MADMYTRLRAMTIRNLKPRSKGGKGLEGVLVKAGENVYNPNTDTNDPVLTEYNISGIRASYSAYYVVNSLVQEGDIKFYLCPVLLDNSDTPAPSNLDRIKFDSKVYTIVQVKEWNYAGVDCGWLLQCRGA